jgi:DNA-binding NarL/FixJ family response regulator
MRKGRPLARLSVTVEDRAQLVAWSKRPKTAQALAMRSRIVLLAADGLSNTVIASQLHTMQHTWASGGGAIWSAVWMDS